MTYTRRSNENGNQTHGKRNDLIFPHIIYNIAYRMLSVSLGKSCRLARFRKPRNTRKTYFKSPTKLLAQFVYYIIFYNENSLYSIVLHTNEQKECALNRASHI